MAIKCPNNFFRKSLVRQPILLDTSVSSRFTSTDPGSESGVYADRPYTHVRLNIYPDGGLARLRVYGQPLRDWNACGRAVLYDLAAMDNGGYVVTANNQHFGAAANY
jgi:allantoicase